MKNALKLKSKLFILACFSFIRDLGRIQTCNLLSRNQVHYSVMLRGHWLIAGANIFLFGINTNNKM